MGAHPGYLRTQAKRGRLIRVVPGSFVEAEHWLRIDARERHRLRVSATAERTRVGYVYSHHAAAAVHGIELLRDWPTTVDVTVDRASGGRSAGWLRRHAVGTPPLAHLVERNGLVVTSAARTAVDLARVLPFGDAVVALDSALRHRDGGALTTADEVAAVLADLEGGRRIARAHAASASATADADSVAESVSRLVIRELGFPTPTLQHEVATTDGGRFRLDFYWPGLDVGGECDGRAKYRDPVMLDGRHPADVVIAEKNRENRLRRVLRGLARWEPADAMQPASLFDILSLAGLPTRRARPPRGSSALELPSFRWPQRETVARRT